MFMNTRCKKRVPIDCPARLIFVGPARKALKINLPNGVSRKDADRIIDAKLCDISTAGCAIDSPYLVPPGLVLKIEADPSVFAAAIKGHRTMKLKFIAKVTSCVMRSPGHYRIGAHFQKMKKTDLAIVEHFVASH
ncbi:MAG: PilZ domain-containing protein [Candidatus Omnitrophica bacterium]|nr:PilZ domain-containing protein [Candidatus Omnitrophota bacterium]